MRRGTFVAALAAALACATAAFAAPVTPNDPLWPQAWGERQVNMPKAWDVTTGDPNVLIAVIDTGVDATIPDLRGAVVTGWDFTDNDSVTNDIQGHGTAAASIIAARGNDGEGVPGYCWRCKLLPVRITVDGQNIDALTAANGIRYAVDRGARIISISWSDEGALPIQPLIATAIAYAAQNNVLVIASAGNTGQAAVTHPAADPGAYAVGATNGSDQMYSWSTYGPWVSFAAPGCQVVTVTGPASGELCGNSATAPAIAGMAGLLLSANSSLTPSQIVGVLKSTALPVPGTASGRVDAYKALLVATGAASPPPPPAPPPPSPPPPPPPPAAALHLTPTPRPRMSTRIQRGTLGRHKAFTIKVRSGRVGITLRSPKAQSCSVSLKSSQDAWVSASQGSKVVSVSAVVRAGKYKVNLFCSVRRPSPFALVLRAVFAS